MALAVVIRNLIDGVSCRKQHGLGIGKALITIVHTRCRNETGQRASAKQSRRWLFSTCHNVTARRYPVLNEHTSEPGCCLIILIKSRAEHTRTPQTLNLPTILVRYAEDFSVPSRPGASTSHFGVLLGRLPLAHAPPETRDT